MNLTGIDPVFETKFAISDPSIPLNGEEPTFFANQPLSGVRPSTARSTSGAVNRRFANALRALNTLMRKQPTRTPMGTSSNPDWELMDDSPSTTAMNMINQPSFVILKRCPRG